MLVEAQLGHLRVVLLVGEAPLAWRAGLASAQTSARSVQTAGDVYAAAAHLLKVAAGRADYPPAEPPVAVLVWIESLRGDEFRFFDLLARRWPALPVAAVYEGTGQDRKLDVCRRKGVTVVSSSATQDWLSQHVAVPPVAAPEPAVADAPAEPPPRPIGQPPTPSAAPAVEPKPAADVPIQSSDSGARDLHEGAPPPTTGTSASDASQDSAALGIHNLPDEAFVDLPDELVAHLPDHLDEDLPEQAPDVEEPSEADLERELPEVEEEDELPPPPLEEAHDSDGRHPHLTPWSEVPRVERQRPARKPPQPKQAPSEPPSDVQKDVPAEGDDYAQKDVPPPPPSRPATNNSALPDYGLLTPEELRALLQDPDDSDDSQEARP